jgi:hypothetical protein
MTRDFRTPRSSNSELLVSRKYDFIVGFLGENPLESLPMKDDIYSLKVPRF